MKKSRGFVTFLLMVIIGGLGLYLYVYVIPGTDGQTQSPMEMQLDALQKAKSVKELNDERNKNIQKAIDEY